MDRQCERVCGGGQQPPPPPPPPPPHPPGREGEGEGEGDAPTDTRSPMLDEKEPPSAIIDGDDSDGEAAAGGKFRGGYGTLIGVGIAYLLVFIGYAGTEALQTHINVEAGLGTTTVAIVYGTFFLSCFGFGPIIIGQFGPKWPVVLAWIFYALFIAANFLPRAWTLYPTAAAIGLGGGPVWIGMGVYTTSLALEHASVTKKPVDKVLSLFNGIFMGIMFFQYATSAFIASTVFFVGDLTQGDPQEVAINSSSSSSSSSFYSSFSSYTSSSMWNLPNSSAAVHYGILPQRNNNNNNFSSNFSIVGATTVDDDEVSDPHHTSFSSTTHNNRSNVCGANYCAFLSTHMEQIKKPDAVFININIGIFLGCSLLGMLILSFQRSVRPPEHKPMPMTTRLLKMLLLLKNPRWLLLSPTFALCGFMQGLAMNTFPQGFINCTLDIRWVAYVLTLRGVTYMVTCFASGKLAEWIPHWVLMAAAYAMEFAVLFVWLFWQPISHHILVFFIIQAVEGIAAASLRVQATALLGLLFPADQEVAFAHLNMAVALPNSIIMAAANFLCFGEQTYVALATLAAGAAGYAILRLQLVRQERQRRRRRLEGGTLLDGEGGGDGQPTSKETTTTPPDEKGSFISSLKCLKEESSRG